MRIPFIAGNWKMYKTISEAREFACEFKKLYHDTDVRLQSLRLIRSFRL